MHAVPFYVLSALSMEFIGVDCFSGCGSLRRIVQEQGTKLGKTRGLGLELMWRFPRREKVDKSH